MGEKIIEETHSLHDLDKNAISTTSAEVQPSPVGEHPPQEDIEPGMTKAKWLACIALGLAYMTAFQQGACLGSIVKSIDEALGPTTYFNWMLSAGTMASSIALPLSGGLSDIFGRRWFLIIGGCFSLLAGVIALAAQNVPTLIASSVVAGFGAGSQQLALAAVAEILPNKYRGRAQAVLDLLILPWSVFGAITGGAMVTYHGKYGFRINFILGICLNTVAITMAYFWYHPPSYGNRLHGKTKRQAFRDLDWGGVFFLNAGILMLLLAISMGGTTWHWVSAPFLICIIGGILSLLTLGFWEARVAKVPFMPRSLFAGKGRTFVMFLCVDFVAGMGLYAAAAFWAQLVRGIWQGTPMRVGVLSIPGGFGGAIGGFAAGMLIGKNKFFNSRNCLLIGTLCKTIADNLLILLQPTGPTSVSYGLGVGFLSMFGTGWTSVSLIVCVQMASADEDLGLATLLLGSMRSIGGSVAVTIYSSILNNAMKKYSGPIVGKAVVPLGFPISGLEPLIIGLINENLEAVHKLPGMNDKIFVAARLAIEQAWAKGFHTLYMSAGIFAAVSMIAAAASKDVTQRMNGTAGEHVAVQLDNEEKKRDVTLA